MYQVLFAPKPFDILEAHLPQSAGRYWTSEQAYFGGDLEQRLVFELPRREYEPFLLAMQITQDVMREDLAKNAFERPQSWKVGDWWDCSDGINSLTYYHYLRSKEENMLVKYEDGKVYVLRSSD